MRTNQIIRNLRPTLTPLLPQTRNKTVSNPLKAIGGAGSFPVIHRPFSIDSKNFTKITLQLPQKNHDEEVPTPHIDVELFGALKQGASIDSLINKGSLTLPASATDELVALANKAKTPEEKNNAAWAIYNVVRYSDLNLATEPVREALVSLQIGRAHV